MYTDSYTDGGFVTKAGDDRTRRLRSASRSRGTRAVWVRKNVVTDQRKLDAARRALGADTETETIDLALDFVSFRREVARGLAAMRRVGGVAEIFETRHHG
jgi:hypothetical protein